VNKVLGIILVVLALAVIIIPMFTDCQSQGKSITLPNGKTVPMKCHWSGVAEIVAAVPLALVGVLMCFTKKKLGFLILSVLGIVLGILVILIPASLIGVCTSGMLCETVMKPALTIMGGLVIIASLCSLLLMRRAES
jgi:hypothetical protein